jgi:HPt (histidine-containing phosphotransfer) domain-containing protein
LTAHALNEVRQKCLAVGMDDFLVKPFDDQQLAETLLRWLEPQPPAESDIPEADARPPLPAAETPPQISVIDMAVIAGLRALDRKGGSSRLHRAVSRFAETTPPIATTIREKCEASDTDSLWRAAHSLKSSAGALGAKQLAQRCEKIEFCARNSNLEETKPLVEGLDQDLTAAIRDLQALIGEMHVPA